MNSLEALPPWRQKMLALALLAGVLGAVFATADAVRDTMATRAARTEAAWDLLAHYRAIAARAASVSAALAAVPSPDGARRDYLEATDPALAAAELQGAVKDIVRNAGATVHSAQSVNPVDDGHGIEVGSELLLTLPLDGLVDMVLGIEAARPFLFIDQLTITSRPATRTAMAPVLQVRLRVMALLDPDGKEVLP